MTSVAMLGNQHEMSKTCTLGHFELVLVKAVFFKQ